MRLKNTKTVVDERFVAHIFPVDLGCRRIRIQVEFDTGHFFMSPSPLSAVRLGLALLLLGLPQLIKSKLSR